MLLNGSKAASSWTGLSDGMAALSDGLIPDLAVHLFAYSTASSPKAQMQFAVRQKIMPSMRPSWRQQ